jgi:hypothetical protein
MGAVVTSWLDEVLHGVRKRDDGPGTELRSLQIAELSGCDRPAHGVDDWLLMKAETEIEDEELAELDAQMRGTWTAPELDGLDALVVDVDEPSPYDDEPSSYPGLDAMSTEELLDLRELLDTKPEFVEDYLEKRAPPRSAFQDLVLGETNRLDLS